MNVAHVAIYYVALIVSPDYIPTTNLKFRSCSGVPVYVPVVGVVSPFRSGGTGR